MNWDEEEPNNEGDNEYCVKISDSYRWSDLKCGIDRLKNSEFPEITLHALCEFDDLTTTSNSTSSSTSNSTSKEGAYLSGGMLNFLEVHQYKFKYILGNQGVLAIGITVLVLVLLLPTICNCICMCHRKRKKRAENSAQQGACTDVNPVYDNWRWRDQDYDHNYDSDPREGYEC